MRAFFKAGPGRNTQICNPVYKFSYRDNTPKLGEDDDLVLQNDGHGDDGVTRSQGAYLWSLPKVKEIQIGDKNKVSISQRRGRMTDTATMLLRGARGPICGRYQRLKKYS